MSDLPRDYPFDDPEEPPAAAGDDTIETPEPSDRPEDAPEAEEMGAPSETEAMAEGPPGGDPTEAASTGGSVDDEAVPEPLEPEVEAGQGRVRLRIRPIPRRRAGKKVKHRKLMALRPAMGERAGVGAKRQAVSPGPAVHG